jgi:hypothetical protein
MGMKKLLLLVLVLLAGCTGTSMKNSIVMDKSAKPVSELRVLYIENQLAGINQPDSIVGKISYPKLGSLLQERAPIIFGLNNIPVELKLVKPSDLIGPDAKKLEWTRTHGKNLPLLELQVISARAMTNSSGTTNVYMDLRATLFHAPANNAGTTMQIAWKGTMSLGLGYGSLGIGNVVFDNEFVDDMLKRLLESMSAAKMIHLADGKVRTSEN